MRLYKTQKTAIKHNIKYYQGKPCRNGHSGIRYANCNRCVECMEKRYKHLLIATPKWISNKEKEQIKNMYSVAEALSRILPEKQSVDHFYPIFGKTVSGLHTISNLRIISHTENMKKKNKHPQEFYQ